MNKRIVVAILVLATAFASTVFAQTAMVAGKETPEGVVSVRKYAMRAFNSNLRDIRIKLDKGQGAAVVPNGAAVAAMAMMLPQVFEKTYAQAYPFPGSRRFFKGADPVKFQSAAEYLNAQAQKLVRIASDQSIKDTKATLDRIKKACRSCHNDFRGEN